MENLRISRLVRAREANSRSSLRSTTGDLDIRAAHLHLISTTQISQPLNWILDNKSGNEELLT
jgi:hypothetical protein